MVAKVSARSDGKSLSGRTLYFPQMAYAGSCLVAAAVRAVGLDAKVCPNSNAETLELGGLYSTGEECLPHRVTLGDFLRICREPGFDPAKTAFFMPTAEGPCRFGQYAPFLKKTLAELGYDDVMILSPTSRNGYDGLGEHADELQRTMWVALVAGDALEKLRLRTRPYEITPGDADQAFEASLADLIRVMERPGLTVKRRLEDLTDGMVRTRDRFRAVPARYTQDRPLIGLVGEIFCRLNSFSNDEIARRVEQHGGECWLSDICEWVWYTNWIQEWIHVREHGKVNFGYVRYKLKTHVQRQYEHALLAPLAQDLRGYEEPADVKDVLDLAEPYLPREGCIGEMVLSVGRAAYLYGKGVDGIIDISPFTCMNGIICEAVYPALSNQLNRLPVRVCYFDGMNTDIDRDLEIFLDLSRGYMNRKTQQRIFPDCFQNAAPTV